MPSQSNRKENIFFECGENSCIHVQQNRQVIENIPFVHTWFQASLATYSADSNRLFYYKLAVVDAIKGTVG